MVKHKGGTDKSQTWLTFLRNHLEVSWAMDFFTVPTLGFQILYIFVILNHSRRQVEHFAVTAHPTMAWVIQQLREAMPFGLPNDRKIKGRQLIGTITGTTVKGTASSGGRLASETPRHARHAGLYAVSVLLPH